MRTLQHYRKNVSFVFANGVGGADLVQEVILPFSGEILHIQQDNGQNTNAATAQITIDNEFGNVLWDGTAKPHNAVANHEFVAARRNLAGSDTLKCTISADPGASGYRVDVIISLFGRDA